MTKSGCWGLRSASKHPFALPIIELWNEQHRSAAFNDLALVFSGLGALPQNITLTLADQTELVKAGKNQFTWHDKNMTMGLTRTRRLQQTQFEHTIYLLNGVNPARLAAVCAHEYAHAWLYENVPPERQLEGNTVEGFPD